MSGAEPTLPPVWVDGELVPVDQARVSVFDRALRAGEGVFETLRTHHGGLFRADAHVARAVAGARALGIELEGARLGRALAAVAAAATGSGLDHVLRATVSAGAIDPAAPFPGRGIGPPGIVVTAQPLPDDLATRAEHGTCAVTVALRRELPAVKSVSYAPMLLAQRRALAAGAHAALLVDADGDVPEAASANLFVVRDGTLITAPESAPLLAGVTRAAVLEVAGRLGVALEARTPRAAELAGADELLLSSAVRGLAWVVTLDGAEVGHGDPGPLGTQLRAGLDALITREITRDSTR